MPELTPEELAELLARLEDLTRQAQSLAADIKHKMGDAARRDHVASDWTDRRQHPERRNKKRA